ncbi:hypothetical protein B5X24_HaOG200127 [Helicoverpa armigera]|uniref:Carboxylesterase type B domain-containing protein n=1 Tax=Helicoverpa armigera TaxID=29058 RepID=A0A2W1BVV3_HELAM|nr:hypothetical protein B5X24_HaOG200127 [Helicoverpa armigera]
MLGAAWAALAASAALCAVLARAEPRPHRDVPSSQGVVRGYLTPQPPHFAYYGLPYASPPTRAARFKDPTPPPKWDGIFEATHEVKCPQLNADGEENCLVVNVFTPEDATSLPVLVLVHDGYYQSGWGAYQPPNGLIEEGFVIVTFNYRLGALGFLCLRIPEAPGNAGLKDQIAMLYWVHMNIAEFGGNPRDVTVYGTGAGAEAVQLLLMSGLEQGLLHKVILESGSVLSPISMAYDPLTVAYNGATSLGYDGSTEPEELYNFYVQASADDLSRITEMFLPCVENSSDSIHNIIDMDPLTKLKDGRFHNVPMLITFTEKEIVSVIQEMEKFQNPPAIFEFLLPNNLEFDDHKTKHRVGEIIKQFYFSKDFTRANMAQSYADYIYDILTAYPIIKMAMVFADKNSYPVYVMKFNLTKTIVTLEGSLTGNFDTLLDYFYKDEEHTEIVLEKLMVLLRNFIRIGDPTPLTSTLIPLIWQPLQKPLYIAEVPLLQFDDTVKIIVPPNHQRLLFLENIYTRFYKPLAQVQQDAEGSGEDQ